jgi:Methylamine utilization protein MauJ
VPRLEIPVRTYLRFTTAALPSPGDEPESVTIEFEGREFGWLAHTRFEHGLPDDPDPGPTLTTLVPADTHDEWRTAHELAQRFLSALAFHFNTRVESKATSGGSSEPELLHPHGAIDARDTYGVQIVTAPSRVRLDADARLRVALAVYREAISAGSPFYAFLQFWNVLEAAFDGDGARRDAFLRRVAPTLSDRLPITGDVATHFRDASRNAVAHVIRTNATSTTIDPDLPEDRERLDLERAWLREVARRAVYERWPQPVILDRRE